MGYVKATVEIDDDVTQSIRSLKYYHEFGCKYPAILHDVLVNLIANELVDDIDLVLLIEKLKKHNRK